MSDLSGKRILITGGASGLGLAMAQRAAQDGARVAIADVHAERLAAAIGSLGEGHLALNLDVTQGNDWAAAMASLQQQWQGLDVLVNNAGIASGGPLENETLAQWQRVIDINLLGIVRGCQAALPLLRESRGAIINVASMAGLIHPPMMGSYNAVKAAVVAYSETLMFELDDQGITVHALCPGFFKTNLAESLPEDAPGMRVMINRIFDKASITAADVAEAAFTGMQRGEFLILTHPDGRLIHRAKRLFPSTVYRHLMRKQTAGMVKAWRTPRTS